MYRQRAFQPAGVAASRAVNLLAESRRARRGKLDWVWSSDC
jgi:hypothetical protein